MSSHAAFLQAITSAPDDDTHRLVYADWLDDNGDPRRAEFIRLQCRLANMDECDPERPELLDREWELLAVYRKRWQPGPDSVLGKRLYNSGFVRGFFGRVRLPVDMLLEHGEEIFREYPLQELHLCEFKGRLGDLLSRPWMAGVSSLFLLEEVLSLDEIRALTTSPYLGGLRKLTVRNLVLSPEGLELLARWPGLRRLTHLCLVNSARGTGPVPAGTRLTETGLRPLLEAGALTQLTSLRLHGMVWETSPNSYFPDAEIALLAHSPNLPALTRLELAEAALSVEAYRTLAGATGLPALRHLKAGWYGVGAEGVPALVASPLLANLDTLDLSTAGFGREAAAALAASPHLGRLRNLDLTWSHVGPEEAKTLATAPFGSLVELNLGTNKIRREGMAALASSSHLATLRALNLHDNDIGTEGTEALVNSTSLAGLRTLNLGWNLLRTDGAKILAGAPHGARLRHLFLRVNMLGARGAQAILRSENLSGLWTLDVNESGMTDATARDVAEKTPLRELRRLLVDEPRNRKLTDKGMRALAASPRLPHLLIVDRTASWENVHTLVLEAGKGQELK
jgi:uncharacterized protein (TIGR02996 family)